MIIIPAIDIIDEKCVRLEQGNFSSKKIYNENPLEIAKMFEANGIKKLHLVDLDGAKSGHIINWEVLNTITSKTNLEIDFGGGIKSDKDFKIAFENGANQITAGSIAVKDKTKVIDWIKKYSADKIILGADVNDEKIAISGWQNTSDINIFDFYSDFSKAGIKYSICTDISKDGMLQGSSIDLYKKIDSKFPQIKLIASGGVSSINELRELKKMGIYGAIIGKAIYENKIKLSDLKEFL